MRWGAGVFGIGLAALLAGCGGPQVALSPGDSGVALRGDGLVGQTFLSTEVREDGQVRDLVEGTRIALAFTEDGEIRVSAGCNTMFGPVTITDERLLIEELGGTEIGCPGDGRHDQDDFVADFLAADPFYSHDGDDLSLHHGGTEIDLTDREVLEPDAPLQETRWTVTSVTQAPPSDGVAGPDTPVAPGPVPEDAYLVFSDGEVTGSDGCNSLRGPAAVEDDVIRFGALTHTEKSCPGTEQATRAMLAVLEGEVRWRIEGTYLYLNHPSADALRLGTGREASDTEPDAPTQAPPVGAAAQDSGLLGADFRSVAVRRNGEAYTLVEGTRITVGFDSRANMSARAGCNIMLAGTDIGREHIVIPEPAVGHADCDPARDAQDRWLAGFLAADPSYDLVDDQLRLRSRDAEIILRPAEAVVPGSPLDDRLWSLTDNTVAGSAEGSLNFAEEWVRGRLGCLRLDGPLRVDGATITFGPVFGDSSRRCTERSRDLLAAVEGPLRYEVTDTRLRLVHPSGASLTFEAYPNTSAGWAGVEGYPSAGERERAGVDHGPPPDPDAVGL